MPRCAQVIFIDEILKCVGRAMTRAALAKREKQD